MQRHEALAVAEQLLADREFGRYRDRSERPAVWTDSALGLVRRLLRGTLRLDGSEPDGALGRAMNRLKRLPDWGFTGSLPEQLRSIVDALEVVPGTPPRFRRPELAPVRSVQGLLLVFGYLHRMWTTRRTQVPDHGGAHGGAGQPGPAPAPPPVKSPPAAKSKAADRPMDPRWSKLASLKQILDQGK